MHFKFNINLTDQDYLNYNIFWMLKSPYGKKQLLKFRITIAILLATISLLSLFGGEFSADAWISIIPYVILLILFELLLNPFFSWLLKGNIRSLKAKGKMGYSPVSEIEFYDESFIEITPDGKSEQKYSAVERVSVIADKVIYIHVNNVMSYILPSSCFESKAQHNDFLDFVRTKCANVDTY
ncbi:MAG: YcxB family protein [Clostridia bacterium]|nr:YcxB family protein [Clostridia bacterium]